MLCVRALPINYNHINDRKKDRKDRHTDRLLLYISWY